MRYATPINVADPFFFFDFGHNLPAGKAGKFAFVDHREFGIFKEQNKNRRLTAVLVTPRRDFKEFALELFRKYKILVATVGSHFPLDLADFLRSKRIKLEVALPLYPERAIKTPGEIRNIEDALKRTQTAFRRIEEILRESVIKKDKLLYQDQALTSEVLKREVDRVLLEADMMNTSGLIISCGAHAAIPHHEGHGPIKPHQPIICDIFPLHRSTGYYADMTRTYVKGKASPEMQRIYDTILKSQEAGIAAVRPGIACAQIDTICSRIIKTPIHGTGHGLGLDIHEPPFLNARSKEMLQVGNVITVEPGLYYADRGSARIEDVVVVTKTGCRNLTNYPKVLIIP